MLGSRTKAVLRTANHVLPTGGTARFRGGLSVLSFLKVSTFLRLPMSAALGELAVDAAELARLEGLEAHARAADLRRRPSATAPVSQPQDRRPRDS